MQDKELLELLRKYKLGELTETERAMLESWYNVQAKQQRPISESALQDQLQQIASRLPLEDGRRRIRWKPFAAVAAVFLVIGVGLMTYFQFTTSMPVVKPGGNRAMLVVSDGRSVQLSETKSGIVMAEALMYDDGTAITSLQNAANEEELYYTIVTPRGGQYKVVLGDGSIVWLNSASSLKYPVHFDDNERRVELTGEGYFEIKKSSNGAPFLVSTATQEVEVLGTHFNINAYLDEPDTKTTLIEGRVKVSAAPHTLRQKKSKHSDQSAILLPGQQAIVSPSGLRKEDVDVSTFFAWKDGMFAFNGAALQDVMRQISRWYDIDVIYQGDQPHTDVYGRIRRDNSLTDVLAILREADINFKLKRKGKTSQLIVSP